MSCTTGFLRCIQAADVTQHKGAACNVGNRGGNNTNCLTYRQRSTTSEAYGWSTRSLKDARCHSGPLIMSPWREEAVEHTGSDVTLLSGVSSIRSSQLTSRRSTSCLSTRMRGQLTVKMEVRGELLRVSIGSARNLGHRESKSPCYYAQVALIPRMGEDNNIRVTTLKRSATPSFNEAFDFHVPNTPARQRILVELKCIGSEQRSQLVGGMSFGLRPLLAKKKLVNGWFYLLNDDLGSRKHMRVAGRVHAERPDSSCSQRDRVVSTQSRQLSLNTTDSSCSPTATRTLDNVTVLNQTYTVEDKNGTPDITRTEMDFQYSSYLFNNVDNVAFSPNATGINSTNNSSLSSVSTSSSGSMYTSSSGSASTSSTGSEHSISQNNASRNITGRTLMRKARVAPSTDSDYSSAHSYLTANSSSYLDTEEDVAVDEDSQNWDFLEAFDNFIPNQSALSLTDGQFNATMLSSKRYYWSYGVV